MYKYSILAVYFEEHFQDTKLCNITIYEGFYFVTSTKQCSIT